MIFYIAIITFIIRLSKLSITEIFCFLFRLVFLRLLNFLDGGFSWKVSLIIRVCIVERVVPCWADYCMHFNLMPGNKAFIWLWLKHSIYYPISWDISKAPISNIVFNYSFLFFGMIIWAFTLSAFFLKAFRCFIRVWMVLNLLPPMAHVASEAIFAPKLIIIYVIF